MEIEETLVLSIGNYLDGGGAVLHNFEGEPLKDQVWFYLTVVTEE